MDGLGLFGSILIFVDWVWEGFVAERWETLDKIKFWFWAAPVSTTQYPLIRSCETPIEVNYYKIINLRPVSVVVY